MDRTTAVISQLQRQEDSHPVLVAYWTTYLENLRGTVLRAVQQAEAVSRDLHHVTDPRATDLAALTALRNSA
jgi:hypothetical protein